jgi:hypothetical protein
MNGRGNNYSFKKKHYAGAGETSLQCDFEPIVAFFRHRDLLNRIENLPAIPHPRNAKQEYISIKPVWSAHSCKIPTP